MVFKQGMIYDRPSFTSGLLMMSDEGLSTAEQHAFFVSVQRVCEKVAGQLALAQTAAEVLQHVVHLHRSVDAVAQQAAGRGVAVACAAGCAHCCRLRVEASMPEVLLIAQTVQQRSAAEQEALIRRLQARIAVEDAPLAASAASLSSLLPLPQQDCAFLAHQRCSIYAVRPAVCRKAHSLSLASCQHGATVIPQDLALLLDSEALIKGVAHAYAQWQLDAAPRELSRAVLAVLQDASAEQRWYGSATNMLQRDGGSPDLNPE